MVSYVAEVFAKALAYAKENAPEFYEEFALAHDISMFDDFSKKLYVPQPNEDNVIEQFDGYFKLEDISLPELKKRIIIPNEYLGGTNGLATTTRILKQADVLMMLNVFRSQYSDEIKKANWEYYEPYTEHGSSLSACAYGIVAAGIGMPDWAYKYFMKTATVDLTGDTKQYLGNLYIGGTHPAANGGSWNTAVFGFGGVSYTDDAIDISPSLPAHWTKLSFKLLWRGVRLTVSITHTGVSIVANKSTDDIVVTVNKKKYEFLKNF
jgi:trehalose/maltose hydrolase-like predicted phosphorylase